VANCDLFSYIIQKKIFGVRIEFDISMRFTWTMMDKMGYLNRVIRVVQNTGYPIAELPGPGGGGHLYLKWVCMCVKKIEYKGMF
jgi:hypothetical protein